jgi:hypothetical protein
MALAIAYDGTSGGVSKDVTTVGSGVRFVTGQVDFDNSYPTGGEEMDISTMLNGADLKGVVFENKSGFVFEYDYTNSKVKAYYADYDAVADGALIQVAATTDLSAVTDVRFLAWGV